MKEKPKVGQKVYVVNQRKRGGFGGEQFTTEVVRVGTKFAYICRYGRESAFDWRTGYSHHKESNERANGFGFDVYDSQQEYAKRQYEAMRIRTLTDRLVTRNGWALADMPLECVEKIHAVLDEFGIETGGDA